MHRQHVGLSPRAIFLSAFKKIHYQRVSLFLPSQPHGIQRVFYQNVLFSFFLSLWSFSGCCGKGFKSSALLDSKWRTSPTKGNSCSRYFPFRASDLSSIIMSNRLVTVRKKNLSLPLPNPFLLHDIQQGRKPSWGQCLSKKKTLYPLERCEEPFCIL